MWPGLFQVYIRKPITVLSPRNKRYRFVAVHEERVVCCVRFQDAEAAAIPEIEKSDLIKGAVDEVSEKPEVRSTVTSINNLFSPLSSGRRCLGGKHIECGRPDGIAQSPQTRHPDSAAVSGQPGCNIGNVQYGPGAGTRGDRAGTRVQSVTGASLGRRDSRPIVLWTPAFREQPEPGRACSIAEVRHG